MLGVLHFRSAQSPSTIQQHVLIWLFGQSENNGVTWFQVSLRER